MTDKRGRDPRDCVQAIRIKAENLRPGDLCNCPDLAEFLVGVAADAGIPTEDGKLRKLLKESAKGSPFIG